MQVAKGRLPQGQGDDGGGVGAEDSGAEADRPGAGAGADQGALGIGEATFRTYQHGPRPGLGAGQVGPRPERLIAEEEAAIAQRRQRAL